MKKFIQLHLLTSYPPSNLNRDDRGQPKTAKMGGTDRLRVSSQSLKRTWRTSDVFQYALDGKIGTRTKQLGREIYQGLIAGGIKEKNAFDWAQAIAGQFGKCKTAKPDKKKSKEEQAEEMLIGLDIEQLVHVSQAERSAVYDLVKQLINEDRAPEKDELNLLRKDEQAVDIALFGRMLASQTNFNVEAACQVAHAISVHPVVIEDDYFTAVDDLNNGEDDAGAAHIGESLFAAGLFYSYVCIDKELLIENLGGDIELANKAVKALIEAAVTVAPKGKQNSYASRAYASYVLAEKGSQQPRSLSSAFLKGVSSHDDDFLASAVAKIVHQFNAFDKAYGQCADERCEINVLEGKGTLVELTEFLAN